jgi:molybdenum cofactor cytidylyltransferase
VTGHLEHAVECLLKGLSKVEAASNPDWSTGLSSSLRRGVERLAPETGFLVALGDTPLFRAGTLDRVLPGCPAQEREVRVPTFEAQRGHPVYFPVWTRPHWSRLCGDRGARQIMAEWAHRVREIPVEDPGIVRDFDRSADFESSAELAGSAEPASCAELEISDDFEGERHPPGVLV